MTSGSSRSDRRTFTYELVCTDCEFETSVHGTVYDALDVADFHQEEAGSPLVDHFVTFKLRGRD